MIDFFLQSQMQLQSSLSCHHSSFIITIIIFIMIIIINIIIIKCLCYPVIIVILLSLTLFQCQRGNDIEDLFIELHGHHGPSIWILLGVGSWLLFKSSGAGTWTETTTVGKGLFGLSFYRLALLRSGAFKRKEQKALDLIHGFGTFEFSMSFSSGFIRKLFF